MPRPTAPIAQNALLCAILAAAVLALAGCMGEAPSMEPELGAAPQGPVDEVVAAEPSRLPGGVRALGATPGPASDMRPSASGTLLDPPSVPVPPMGMASQFFDVGTECGAEGEPCCSDDTCDAGSSCDATSHTCIADMAGPAPSGPASCGGVGEPCCGSLCDDSLYCDDASGTCAPCVNNAACTAEGGCVTGITQCAGGARTCDMVDVAPVGSACGSAGQACDADAHCVACGGEGEPCCAGSCGDGLGCSAALSTCERCPSGTVLVQSDAFDMGSTAPSAEPDESPVHHVTIRSFCMDVTEVTVSAYEACPGCTAMGTDPGCNQGRPDQPANCVTWEQATIFCAMRGGHLPTEAEWEFAARGTAGSEYAWGADSPSCALACYAGCTEGTVAVASYAPTHGIYDLEGNVSEWTADDYDAAYYADPAASGVEPSGPYFGSSRVVRGGSYLTAGSDLRASNRDSATEDTSTPALGFRCALDPGASWLR